MRILYHHRIASKDGQYVHVVELTEALKRLGHEIIMVCPNVAENSVFGSEGGTDGADKITCNTAPPVGSRLTFSFTGRLKVRAKFAEDMFSFETFYDRLANAGIKLKGLLNA